MHASLSGLRPAYRWWRAQARRACVAAVLLCSLPLWPAGSRPAAATCFGVTSGSSGYTFSWLHVSSAGVLVDSSGCPVALLGFNLIGMGYGNGVGSAAPQLLKWYKATFHMNVWRIELNSYWWVQNLWVPAAKMSYQAWIETLVGWIEQNGAYVMLQTDTQFHDPPCGGSISYCAPEMQGRLNNPIDPTQCATGVYISDALSMWSALATHYANDPAVLYNDWDEMKSQCGSTLSDSMWRDHQNQLINTIRSANPRSLVLISGPNYGNDMNPIVQGAVPDLTQPNLVWDYHVEGPNNYINNNWPTNANQQVDYAHSHGHAVSFNEWGGTDATDAAKLWPYSIANHVGMLYYEAGNVATPSGAIWQLTSVGKLVQSDYASA